ncbi:MAG: prolyl-tRNA synthetase associated domain-containing protein [Christensenellales bacterium]
MFFVSDIYTTAPSEFKTDLQAKTYQALDKLHIPFERVDTDEAITMEDCVQIDKKLNMKMVKTLFLCNRQQTAFYLFITAGDKPFRSKEFSNALEVARVSFAPLELMEQMLGTKVGAATVFSAMLDTGDAVQIIFDRAVIQAPWYGCSDGTTTGYMRVQTEHILQKFLPFANHIPAIIEV